MNIELDKDVKSLSGVDLASFVFGGNWKNISVKNGNGYSKCKFIGELIQNMKKRTEQEKLYISNAKQVLMKQNHLTEEEAFRYIQKCSMDSGTNMVETAQKILLMIGEKI